MFSTFDCAVKGYRQKEDAWNAILSGFMTGGCLAARSWYSPIVSVMWMIDSALSQVARGQPSVLLWLVVSYWVFSKASVCCSTEHSAKPTDKYYLLVRSFSDQPLKPVGRALTEFASLLPSDLY